MGYGKERPCKNCSKTKLIQARGLCQQCFTAATKSNTLEQYPPKYVRKDKADMSDLERLQITVRTFLHDIDAHESAVKTSQIRMTGNMWLQVEALRKLVL